MIREKGTKSIFKKIIVSFQIEMMLIRNIKNIQILPSKKNRVFFDNFFVILNCNVRQNSQNVDIIFQGTLTSTELMVRNRFKINNHRSKYFHRIISMY